MSTRYFAPGNTEIYPGHSFTIGTGNSAISYPANWLHLANDDDLAEHFIIKEVTATPPFVPTPQDIINAQTQKIQEAFTYMEDRIKEATVNVPIASEELSCPFGCDQTTQDNIIGINLAVSIGIPIPNPTYWTPKGYPFPIQITHQELVSIGGAILNKKNELYTVYFGHKANIMMTSDYTAILSYNVTSGY